MSFLEVEETGREKVVIPHSLAILRYLGKLGEFIGALLLLAIVSQVDVIRNHSNDSARPQSYAE
jgi:hypothetical protein